MSAQETSYPSRDELLELIETLRAYSRGGACPKVPQLNRAQLTVLRDTAVGPG